MLRSAALRLRESAQVQIFDVTARLQLTLETLPDGERSIRAGTEGLLAPGTQPAHFRLQVFRKYSASRLNSLSIGQTIRMFHSESEGYLATCGTDGQGQYLVVDTESTDGADHCHHLFHVVNPDLGRRASGGYIRTGDLFRLYNFTSQAFLALDRTGGPRGGARYKLCGRHESQMAESHFMLQQLNVRKGEPVEIGSFYMIVSIRHAFVEAMGLLEILQKVLASNAAGNTLDRWELTQLASGSTLENRIYAPKFHLIVDTAVSRALQHSSEDCVRLSSKKDLLWEAILASLQIDKGLEYIEMNALMTLIWGRQPLQWPSGTGQGTGSFRPNFANHYIPAELQMQVRPNTFIQSIMTADGVEAAVSGDRTTKQLTQAVRIEGSGLESDSDLFRFDVVPNSFAQHVAHVSSMVFYIQQMACTTQEVHNLKDFAKGDAFDSHDFESRVDTAMSADDDRTSKAKLKSVFSLIKASTNLHHKDSHHATVRDHLEQTEIAVSRLCQFFSHQGHGSETAAQSKYVNHRLQLLYHLGFFEAATAFLTTVSKHFLLKRDSDELTTHSQYSRLNNVVSQVWELICHAVRGFEPAGVYMVESSLELFELQISFGSHALSALVEAFNSNHKLNEQINSKDGAALRDRICHFAIDALLEYGRIPLLYTLLSNICCCRTKDGRLIQYQRTARLVMDLVLVTLSQPVLVERRVSPESNRLQVKGCASSDGAALEETWLHIDEIAAGDHHGFDLQAFFRRRASADDNLRPPTSFSACKACVEMLAAICVPCNHRDLQTQVRQRHELSNFEIELFPAIFTWEEVTAAAYDAQNDMQIRCLYLRILTRIFLTIDNRDRVQSWCWPRVTRDEYGEDEPLSDDQSFSTVSERISESDASFVGVEFGIDEELWNLCTVENVGSRSQQEHRFATVASNLGVLIADLESGTKRNRCFLDYGFELLRVCTGLVPRLALELREHLKVLVDEMFRKLAVQIKDSKTLVDGAEEAYEEAYVVQLCRLYVQLITTNVEEEHIKSFVETMYDLHVLQGRGVTAEELFELVDESPQQEESSPAVIYLLRSNSLAIRCAAIQLLEATGGQHSKLLLDRLKNLVYVGERGGVFVDRLEKAKQEVISCAKALEAVARSTGRRHVGVSIETRESTEMRLTAALDAVSNIIEDDDDAVQMMLTVNFHQYIVDVSTTGLASGILSIVKLDVDESYESRRTAYQNVRRSKRELIQACFRFLTFYVRGAPKNQHAVEPCVPFLLDHYLGAELFGSGSELLFFNDAFKGCHGASLISGKHLVAICRHCRWQHASNSAHLYLDLLAILAYNSGQAIRENQNVIFDEMVSFRMAPLDIDLWLEKHPSDERLNSIKVERLKEMAKSDRGGKRVQFHTCVIHLLANCATANASVASQLRGFLP